MNKELKAFGLKQSFPLYLLVMKYFLCVSDMKKKGSSELENRGIYKCPPPPTQHGGEHDREGLRKWEQIIKSRWIIVRYPKQGS